MINKPDPKAGSDSFEGEDLRKLHQKIEMTPAIQKSNSCEELNELNKLGNNQQAPLAQKLSKQSKKNQKLQSNLQIIGGLF